MDEVVQLGDCGMSASTVQQFLRRVARRHEVISLARQWRFFLLIGIGVYALALLLSRLFGFIPAWFTPITLAILPAATLILAWISYRRPRGTDAARVTDAHMATHDLFLTASLIGNSLGSYQDLVLQEAEQRVKGAVPAKVLPFHWQRDTLRLGAVLAVVALAVYFLPQWDPFGLHQREKHVAEQRERIREINKATQVRAALLDQKSTGEQSEVVKQALANLEKTFKEAKPNDKAGTLARLNDQQKSLGQLWKQTSEEKLKNALNVPPPSQSFGVVDPAKADRLKSDLQKGDVSSAKKELDELQQKAQELAEAKDPVAREKLRQEIMDRLQNLKDTLDQQGNSQALDSDMQRALEQLAMSNLPNLSGEALKGMTDSLKLTQKELEQLARAMADMKNLEEALKALQMAKALHNMQPLNGKDFIGLGDLAAYESFCQGRCNSLCAGMGMNSGYGMGPRPYGSENSQTGFKPEKSASLLQPGKMLMEWKTREVSDAGPAREEYLRAVQDVRQQASEAVVQEQIPPGYQAAIKKYFDTLHNDAPATPQP
jgi:tetratricopeptide (TPR) repeat protein